MKGPVPIEKIGCPESYIPSAFKCLAFGTDLAECQVQYSYYKLTIQFTTRRAIICIVEAALYSGQGASPHYTLEV